MGRDTREDTPSGLVDAHTHLDSEAFDGDRDLVVGRARQAGVTGFVLCASDPDRWDRTAAVARAVGGDLFLGLHPWAASETGPAERDELLARLRTIDLDGVGEIGLDTLHASGPDEARRQREAARAQLAVARERDVPVALHCVRAYPELLAIAERDGLPRAGGMVHGWSGPADQVERAVRLGLHVSFGPLILRDKARKARESVARVPADRLLVETDCPTVRIPGVDRGEPAHLLDVVAGVAALRGEDPEVVGPRAAAHFRRMMGRAG